MKKIILAHLLIINTAFGQEYLLGVVNNPSNILFSGNSLLYGAFATTPDSNIVGRVAAVSHKRDIIKNQGIPGNQIFYNMLYNFNDSILFNYKAGYNNIVVGWELTNNIMGILNVSQPANIAIDSTYSQYKRFFLQAQAAGFKTIAGTCIARDGGGTHPLFDSCRLVVNQMIRDSFPSLNIIIADFASDFRLSDSHNTTYFDSDRVHLLDAGFRVCFEILLPKLKLLL